MKYVGIFSEEDVRKGKDKTRFFKGGKNYVIRKN